MFDWVLDTPLESNTDDLKLIRQQRNFLRVDHVYLVRSTFPVLTRDKSSHLLLLRKNFEKSKACNSTAFSLQPYQNVYSRQLYLKVSNLQLFWTIRRAIYT